MSRKLLCVKKNKAELRYYSPVYAAICFGPRSKSILWSKTASRDFSWDRSPFPFFAQAKKEEIFCHPRLFSLATTTDFRKGMGRWRQLGLEHCLYVAVMWHLLWSHGSEREYQNIHLLTSSFCPGQTRNLKYSFWNQGIISYNASTIRNQERQYKNDGRGSLL